MCGEAGLVATKPAAIQGSGQTHVILPSCVLQQFSDSPSSDANLITHFPAAYRTALEISCTALRHSACTCCFSFCPVSLPASISPETFPGSPGHRQEGAGQGGHSLSEGLCVVLTLASTKHPPAVLSIPCPSGMGGRTGKAREQNTLGST